MYDVCKKRMEEKTTIAHNMEELKKNLEENQGFVKTMWCGSQECEDKVKEETGAPSRCMPFEQEHLGDTCVCCGKPATENGGLGKTILESKKQAVKVITSLFFSYIAHHTYIGMLIIILIKVLSLLFN